MSWASVPRELKIPNRSAAASIEVRRRAEPGNALHVGAPMPGRVVSVSVESGTQTEPGDKLLTLVAMKMESTIYSDREGIVEEVIVQPGVRVDGKKLLLGYGK
jgi:pyruvate carboxylase